MTYYRIYGIGPDQHIREALEAFCSSDEDALAQAAPMASRFHQVEVWERTRVVGKIEQTNADATTSA